MKVTIFFLMGLLSLAMASTLTEPVAGVTSLAKDAAPAATVPDVPASDAVPDVPAGATETATDMDGSASNIVARGEEMEADGTSILPNTAVQENYVGQYSTRTCSTLGTSVVNLNQCCSVNSGPIDTTNIKKCCLAVGSVCNDAPNSCCHYKQVSCLETSPGSSILTCQRVDVQVIPSLPSYSTPVNAYGGSGVGYNNQKVVSPINYQQQSVIVNGLNPGYGNDGYNNNNNAGYGLNLNSGLGYGAGSNNYAANPITNYAANTGYGQPNVVVEAGYNNLLVNNNPNNYGNGASGYGYAAAAAAAAK